MKEVFFWCLFGACLLLVVAAISSPPGLTTVMHERRNLGE